MFVIDVVGQFRRWKEPQSKSTVRKLWFLFLTVLLIYLNNYTNRVSPNYNNVAAMERTSTRAHSHVHRKQRSVSATALRASRCCFGLIHAVLMGFWLPLKGRNLWHSTEFQPSLISPRDFWALITPCAPVCVCVFVCVFFSQRGDPGPLICDGDDDPVLPPSHSLPLPHPPLS